MKFLGMEFKKVEPMDLMGRAAKLAIAAKVGTLAAKTIIKGEELKAGAKDMKTNITAGVRKAKAEMETAYYETKARAANDWNENA